MNIYRNQALIDLVVAELSAMDKEEIESMTFENSSEYYDYDKLMAEGSTWIVYCQDLRNDYYKQNKQRLDNMLTCWL